MPTLELTDQQVVDLVKQLPATRQAALFKTLLTQQWSEWEELSRYGEVRIRSVAAERGRNWDTMTEDDRCPPGACVNLGCRVSNQVSHAS